jgi:transposase
LLDVGLPWQYPLTYVNGREGRIRRWHAAANHPASSSFHQLSGLSWNTGNVPPRFRRGWPSAPRSSYGGRTVSLSRRSPGAWSWGDALSANGFSAFFTNAWQVLPTHLAAVARPYFPPEVAVHLVKMACERPDQLGRSLSQGDCRALARPLEQQGIVEHISAATGRRLLVHHQRQPWRHHLWLSPTTPRDAAFCARVAEVVALYTRPLRDDEMVLSGDEKTALPPRPRLHVTRPAIPGWPNQVEHESTRDGALNRCAGFDTRTGRVYGQCYARKRQCEFIAFMAYLDAEIPTTITTIHLICDNARPHHGQHVRAWLQCRPRLVLHVTPVHCSWLNQVEQWFAILQRKRLRIVDFASKADLQAKLMQFIAEWNEVAHPVNWTTTSVAKVMAEAIPAAA